MNRLQLYFDNITRYDALIKEPFINIMQIPKILQLNLNSGIGKKAIVERKQMIAALLALELITGQKVVLTRAKKSIDKFKLREKMPIGCKVTLRKINALRFIERLIENVQENFTIQTNKRYFPENSISFGIKDLFTFKEIQYEKFDQPPMEGIDIIVQSSKFKYNSTTSFTRNILTSFQIL